MQESSPTSLTTQLATTSAQLKIWTKKFAEPLILLHRSVIQDIKANDNGWLYLECYQREKRTRHTLTLSVKKNESGIFVPDFRLPSQPKPNSFVQIARKYFLNRTVESAYASLSPIAIIINFTPFSENEENLSEAKAKRKDKIDISDYPSTLILDLDNNPPRLIVAKKYEHVPERYSEVKNHFFKNDSFYESFCEWSMDSTKTKRRLCFSHPLITYQPYLTPNEETELFEKLKERKENLKQKLQENEVQEIVHESLSLQKALDILPSHIRRPAKTKIQFFARKQKRQIEDLPLPSEMERLTKQCEGLKNHLYLWPENSLTWYVPEHFIEEYSLPAVISLERGQKPSVLLEKKYNELDVLKRRYQEISIRIVENEKAQKDFEQLVILAAEEFQQQLHTFFPKLQNNILTDKGKKEKENFCLAKGQFLYLNNLSKRIDTPLVVQNQSQKFQDTQTNKSRLPYRQFYSRSGLFIRVARSASDGDDMVKLMPSHHYWLHVLQGEGSHVWLEKPAPNQLAHALREAAILAIHFSKLSKAAAGDVQVALKSGIEKKKNLPPGKVLVRRAETTYFKYTDDELKSLLETKQS